MFATDEKIAEILIEYVEDNRYKQAVLIDGDWGSGKTFFIQEKFIKTLKDKFKNNPASHRSVLYVSLYGVESFSQVLNDIYIASLESFFNEKLSDGTGAKIGKGINITAKLITAGMKYFNLEKDDLPKLSDLKEIKNSIIVFDDLERCPIDTVQLLGFINSLVEHNAIKVILVANQAEIGKSQRLSELPQKYLVVLNPNLNPSGLHGDIEKAKRGETHKQMSVEELKEYAEKLFPENTLYEKVKEKLIGLTIYYKANMNSIYDDIVKGYIKCECLTEKLLQYKDIVISIFEKRKHSNIRTLIFSLMAYERAYITVSEIDFDPVIYIEKQYEQLLCYVVEMSIQLKTGRQLNSWVDTSAQFGTVYLGASGMWRDTVFGYRFIDTYLTTHFWDSEEVKSVVISIMSDEKTEDEHREIENSLGYNKLHEWWYLEDEEVANLIEILNEELDEKKYHPRYFKQIIVTLMQLERFNFTALNYPEKCSLFISFMKRYLEESDESFSIELFKVFSDDQAFVNKYNLIIGPLLDVLHKKNRETNEHLSEALELEESWGGAFSSCCEKYKDYYISENKFFACISPKMIIDKLRESKVKDIYLFLDGISEVYSFSNLNTFFKADIDHICEILETLNIEALSDGKTTKRIALEKLKKKLEESKELIQA